MNKPFTLILIFLISTFTSAYAQHYDIRALLSKIDKATNSLEEGQFTMHDLHSKISIGEDTIMKENSINCFFKRLMSDTTLGYQLASLRNDGYDRIYDGQLLFTNLPWSKTLEVTDKEKYPKKICELKNDYFLFPFFKYLNKHLQYFNTDTLASKVIIHGIVSFKGDSYYKVEAGTSQQSDKLKVDVYYYVSTKTFLPIRQTVKFESIIGQATEIETFDYWISDLKTSAVSDGQFAKQALTGYNKEKPFSPSDGKKEKELLAIGAVAPTWELPLLSGSKLKLTDLKGKVVILDFWYKACAPCQKQMLALQKLHEKFDKNAVVFIGVNTIDNPIKDKLVSFLKLRNVTMPSVYNGKSIEGAYGVYASPALFIIDKDGKILFTLDGYSDTLLEDVSKIVKQHI